MVLKDYFAHHRKFSHAVMKFIPGRLFALAVIIAFLSQTVWGQYPPPAGYPGTTAMSADSSAFVGWAKSCTVVRGFIDIADTALVYNGTNKATYGDPFYGVGR